MQKSDILKKIIEDGGSCDGVASPSVCARCPLANAKLNFSGSPVNCLDTVLEHNNLNTDPTDDLRDMDLNSLYKAAAESLLTDLELKETILGVK